MEKHGEDCKQQAQGMQTQSDFAPGQQAPYEVFAIDGEACIMEQEHLGIMNGKLSVNTTYRDVLSFKKLFAPPYVSSDFALECRLFGEKVRTRHYRWYPFEIRRRGELKDIEVASVLLLPPGIRAGIMAVTLNNTSEKELEIPVQFATSGGLDRVEFLGFAAAKGEKKTTDIFANQRLIKWNDAGAICLATNLKNIEWEPFSSHLEARLKLAAGEHILQFLKADLTNCYAFSPVKGEGFGPWYPANQEKIISSIYYYLLFSGDVGFLNEQVNEKTILEWAIYHALHLDNLSKPAVLVDYGDSNDHLELRREYHYDNALPDLNGKRYLSLLLVEEMTKLTGKKRPVDFVKRAKDLKRLIREKMWDEDNNWFFFLGKNEERHTRYTFEILLLLGTGVLEPEQEDGLLSHLNEEEFLSAYGIHSISKKDPAYDQKDIDHGGGGAYTGNPPELVRRLYKSGHPRQAEDILRRILWWGERMPYWGDSMVANQVDYRRDTPLMNEISALSGAQCVIFGMFGVKVSLNGDVTINPQPPRFAPDIALRGLKIRGLTFDIAVDHGGEYLVTVNGRSLGSKVGRRVVFFAEQRKLKDFSGPAALPFEVST